ncbi:MAG TPA: IS4 family transposase [Mycobacterium sp.]|nr:IS4 family transposase [Mycobacterium sp.]
MSESSTVRFARPITAAAGVYAPGHIGELTQYLPFELVDDVLSETKTVQRRLRDLPSRVGVYFVLALMLFPRLGYPRVWQKLTAGLRGLELPSPSEKALRDLRRRLGPAPFKALFEIIAGPLGQPHTPGVSYRGLRTVAFDGCNSLRVPDTERNRSWLGRIRYRMGFAGYPTLRMMTLVETGTRSMLGAVLGSAADRDEATLARRLLPLLHPGVVVLLDRAFDAAAFLTELDQTGARFLVRSKSTRRPPVLAQLPDGSFLSDLGGLPVRIIDADLTVTGADGSRVRDRYRLITTLLDHDHHPAAELVRLYHERWEIEIAYLALRHTILDGQVLRSQDRPGLEQEVWALLIVYQLLRMAMVTAVESRPDTNPDRASFTTALQAARDQLIAADAILPTDQPGQSGQIDLLGVIGRAVLATLLPPRRARWSTRRLKNATARYLNRDDRRPHLPTMIASIQVILHTPSVDTTWRPRLRRPRNANAAPTRREIITTLMQDDPGRPWRGRELADKLAINARNMLTQLAEWTRLGFLTRTDAGTYKLPTRRDAASP